MADPRHVALDFDDWHDVFKPIEHTGPGAGSGINWETYGEDHEHVQLIATEMPGRVWTFYDDGETVTDGMHFVNRLAYHITERALADGVHVTVVDIERIREQADPKYVAEYEGLDPEDDAEAEEIAELVKSAAETLEFVTEHLGSASDIVATD